MLQSSRSSLWLACLILFATLGASPVAAQVLSPLVPDASHWSYGSAFDIDGDVAVVGAVGADGWRGRVHVFRRVEGTWTEEQVLVASDAAVEDGFGGSVAIEGNLIVVGAVLAPGGLGDGSAYVFRYDGTEWAEERRWVNVGYNYGGSVTVAGGEVFVGASRVVYAYRYENDAWELAQTIQGSDLLPGPGWSGNGFGTSAIAASGDLLVVGSPFDEEGGGRDFGAAYVFRRDGTTWAEEQKLIRTNEGELQLGRSAALNGDIIVLGAPFSIHSGEGSGPGSAYVFRYADGVWLEEQRLTAPAVSDNDGFGYSLAVVDSETVVIGAPRYDPETPDGMAEDAGAVFVFRRDGGGWNPAPALVDAGDGLVNSVTGSGSRLIVGEGEPFSSQDIYVLDLTGTTASEGTAPAHRALTLSPLWPNPTSIDIASTLTVGDAQHIRAEVFDMLGRRVAVVHDGPATESSAYALRLDASGLPPGRYVLRVAGAVATVTRPFTVVR